MDFLARIAIESQIAVHTNLEYLPYVFSLFLHLCSTVE